MHREGKGILDLLIALDPAGTDAQFRPRLTVAANAVERRSERVVSFPADAINAFEQDLLRNVTNDASWMDKARTLGTRLFEALVPDDLRPAYEAAYRQARKAHTGLQIRIQASEQSHNVPLELLYDPLHDLFLAANNFTVLVRSAPGDVFDVVRAEHPLQLLVVVAAPKGYAPVAVESELKKLREGLASLDEAGVWKIDVLRGPNTIGQLQSLRNMGRIHVMHFIGHGVVDPASGNGALVFEDARGEPNLAEPRRLLQVLAGYSNLRLVVLNACHGGRESEGRPYSSVAHHLLRPGIPAVIAMQRRVSDRSAVLFAEYLYRALANCRSVGEAVNSARTSLMLAGLPETEIDWFNAQVFLRNVDGYLFRAPSGVPPWEEVAQEMLKRGDLDGVLNIYLKVADWDHEADWFLHSLAELGRRIVQLDRWDALAQLVALCEKHRVSLPELERWKCICKIRGEWTTRFDSIQERLKRGDAVDAARSATECDALIETLSRDRRLAQQQLYAGDVELYQKCWASDLSRLRDLREGFRGTLISPVILEVVEVIDRLLAWGGVPVIMPSAEGALREHPYRVAAVHGIHANTPHDVLVQKQANLPANAEPALRAALAELASIEQRLLADFYVQPLSSPARMRQARQSILDQASRFQSNPPERFFADELQDDWPLVQRVRDPAFQARPPIDDALRASTDRARTLRLLHQRVLSTIQSQDVDIGAWGALLGYETIDDSYWHAWCREREAAYGVKLPPGAGERLIKHFTATIRSRLTPPNPPAAKKGDAPGYRDMVLDNDSPEPPTPSSSTTHEPMEPRWLEFLAEMQSARLIHRLHRQGHGRDLALPGGARLLAELGLQENLVALYRQVDHAARSADSALEEAPFELRAAFSSLGSLIVLLQRSVDPSSVRGFAQLACPLCASQHRNHDGAWAFVSHLPPPLTVNVCTPYCPRYAESHPIHARLDTQQAQYADDVRRLALRLVLATLWPMVRRTPMPFEQVQERLRTISVLRGPWREVDQQLEAVQETMMSPLAWPEQFANATILNAHLDVLRLLQQMRPDPKVDRAIARGLLDLAQRWYNLLEPDLCRAHLGEALTRDPHLDDAREMLCEKILDRAEYLEQVCQPEEALANLHQFWKVHEQAPTPTVKLAALLSRARDLQSKLEDRRGTPLSEAERLLEEILRDASKDSNGKR